MATPAVQTLTVPQLAALWQVSVKTVWREVRRGRLRAVRVGRSVRIRATAIEAYERANAVT